jgi:hypothetical protein
VNGDPTTVKEPTPAVRTLDRAVVLTLVIAVFGLVSREAIDRAGLAETVKFNIFNVLFVRYEAPFLTLLALFALAVGITASHACVRAQRAVPILSAVRPPSKRAVLLVALGTLVVSYGVWVLVMHRYLFSMDEFSIDFQARIFARLQAIDRLGAYTDVRLPEPRHRALDLAVPAGLRTPEGPVRDAWSE